MRRSARLQAKQDAKPRSPNLTKTSSSKPSTPPKPPAPEPTPLEALHELPPELRLMVRDFAINSEQGGLSKEFRAEVQPLIRAAQGIGCKQTDFAIGLPHLTDMPDDRFGGGLLQAMQEREGLGTRNHDITPANIFVFETAHLGDDSPNAVICYLERGEEYFPYDIVEGSTSRRNHIQGELLEAMDDAKKVPGDNGPIVDVFEQEDDDSEDPIARTKRLHIEAMTYLAESVRSAVCEPIYEEEPRMLGPGRGISYGFESE